MMVNGKGDMGSVLIDNNYLMGGNYTLHMLGVKNPFESFTLYDMIIRNNIFDPDALNHQLAYTQGEDITISEKRLIDVILMTVNKP